jgi:class 3 adenylate cyclase/tetratricopeptide (TPR) repeat protein
MQTCVACGQENPDGFKFCGACAAPLDAAAAPPREERKVITVLFADLVGFTSRAEKLDPEDVRGLLSPYYARLRHELERHGGTVEKFIGDAVVALFGAPTAHEDDPERAVRAALAIREAIAELNEADPTLELEVRIAVNTGEALVALGARPELGEGMASGDVVNTAARLQAAAPVNGVLVGEATQRATGSVIEYREAEPVEAKGKSQPVPAWEALLARARFGLDVEQRPRTRLIGREQELELLMRALERVRKELSPQLATLVGVPGIGKSRLIAELFQVVDADPDLILWRQGRSLPYGEALSYWALAEIVKSQVGILETDSTSTAEAKLRTVVTDAIDDVKEATWIERHLRPLVGLDVALAEGTDRRAEAFAAWRRFLEALAEGSPIVLVFEDLHWADDGLLDFVDYLADWASGVALLIVGTARPELLARRPGWGGGKRNASTVTVSALAADETAQLLATLLDQVLLPAEIHGAVLQRTEGNPLFAEEYVRMLQDRGFLVQSGGGWKLEEREQLPLPESVQGMIAARLDSLPPEDKELVQNAAVLGKVFWSGALGSLSGREPFVVEEQLHSLERKEFVRRERRSAVAGETQYSFLHLLLRDVAYSQIPRAERADKHASAAAWIESLSADRSEDRAEMLAHHYAVALELVQTTGGDDSMLREPARMALTEAAERAFALHAPTAAADYLKGALELTDEHDPGRAGLLFTYLKVKWAVGEEDLELAERVHDLAVASGQLELAAQALDVLGHQHWTRGEHDLAMRRMSEAFALVADGPPSQTKTAIQVALGNRLILAGEEERGLELTREGLAEAEAAEYEEVAADALRGIGTFRADNGDEGGLADLERSVELGEKLSDPLTIHRALNNLANMHWHFGRLGEGARYLRLDREIQERFGLTPESSTMRWIQGEEILLLDLEGAWKTGLRSAREFLAALGDERHYLVGPVLTVSSYVLAAQGDLSGALADSERALALGREITDPQQLYSALLFRAWPLLLDGKRDDSEALLDELLDLNPRMNEWWFRDLPWLMLELGREGEYLERAKTAPDTLWLEAGVAVAQRDFATAASLYEQIGAKGAEAIARLHAAEDAAAAGRRSEADAELAKAQPFFEAEGATPYLRRCETLLAAAS